MNQSSDWDEFLNLLIKIDSKEMMDEVLTLFFTLSETESLENRYKIIKALLKAEMTQREISSSLKQSISKITAGSNALKRTSSKLIDFLNQEIN